MQKEQQSDRWIAVLERRNRAEEYTLHTNTYVHTCIHTQAIHKYVQVETCCVYQLATFIFLKKALFLWTIYFYLGLVHLFYFSA